jgi:hypothetical protein
MARAKQGERYVCDECGMVVSVEEPCTCDACGIVCCDVPMMKKAGAPGKAKGKAKKKAAPSKAGRAPKKAKAAVKRKVARK